MAQKQNHFCLRLGLSISLLVGGVSFPIKFVLAQPIPDETLGTESSTVNNVDGINSTQINGGASRGSNLFHSFKQFNVGEEQKVFFNSPPGISNILTRVTGGSPSEILGSLGVIGDANLFLMNPNGIIFGANARLDLKGSFIASTANSAIFADGIQYSATNPQASSLLTVSIPQGLQYGGTASTIQIQEATLEVQDGQTLGLIGGAVSVEGGNLIAPAGRIELGSVASNSLVRLNAIAKGWSLGYENVSNFQNIRITKGIFNNRSSSFLDTSGDSGGDISLQGKQILLADTSQISSTTGGAGTGGNLLVNASELFLIKGFDSLLSTATTATGSGGNITVNTSKLILEDRAGILTDSSGLVETSGNIRLATGKAGNLILNASTSVELRSGSSLSSITLGLGDAGKININTASLIVQDESEVAVSSSKIGDAGNIQVQARTISLDNGGRLTATSELGTGGGNIFLQDLNSLTLRRNSEISTSAQGEGNGGNIEISTKLLTALENSNITANAIRGRGGNIRIKTQGLFLSPDSKITATSERGVDGVVEIDRLENDPENALLTLPAEPVNISGLIAQGCSSGAGSVARRGSEFVITGRGGLPPTPKEAFRGDVALVDLGKPIQAQATQAKVVAPTDNQNHPESTELVEAQGWVIGSDGEVTLTASAPNVTPSIPWMKSNSCHG